LIGLQLTEFGHRPALLTGFTPDLRTFGGHLIFFPAMWTLIEHLMQVVRPIGIADPDPLRFLPGEFIVDKSFSDDSIDFIHRKLVDFFH